MGQRGDDRFTPENDEKHKALGREALRLALLGYRMFPIKPGEKDPYSKKAMGRAEDQPGGCYLGTTDKDLIVRWFNGKKFYCCNWACWIPPECVVIDVDLNDLGEAAARIPEDVLQELMQAGAITVTASGGRHYWFRQPEPNRWRGKPGAVPLVDIKTSTGYVVMPPSIATRKHGGEGEYQWSDGSELTLPPDQLPVTPPAITVWLDKVLGVTDENERSSIGTPGVYKVVEPVPGYARGSLEDFINTSPGWQEQAVDLFQRGEKVQEAWDKGGVLHFKRPGSKRPFGATWNAPPSRHGARNGDNLAIALGYPRLDVWSGRWTHIHGGDSNNHQCYSTVEVLRIYTPDPKALQKMEEEWASEFKLAQRKVHCADAGQPWRPEYADWSFLLWENWRIEHDPHVRDCEAIAAELDGDKELEGLLDDDPVAHVKPEVEAEEQAKSAPEAEVKDAGPSGERPKPASTKDRTDTGDLCGQFDFAECSDVAQMAEDLSPEELMEVVLAGVNPDGVIARTISVLAGLARHKQPLFNIGAGLMNMSMTVGSQVQGPTGQMGNIYMIGVVGTGRGKDMPLKVVKQLEEMVSPVKIGPDGNPLSSNRIADIPHSGSALIQSLRSTRVKGLLVDELGTWLQISRFGSQNSNQAGVLRQLTKLYSAGRGPYIVSEYTREEDRAKSKPLQITPFVSMFSMTQPEIFNECINISDLDSGLLGRLIVFQGNNAARAPKRTPYKPLTDGHIARIAEPAMCWRNWDMADCDFVGLHENVDSERYLAMRFEPEAEMRQTVFGDACDDASLALAERDMISGVVLTRVMETAGRIAVLLAADSMGDPRGYSRKNRPVITTKHMDLALLIAAWNAFRFRMMIERNLASSPEHRWHKRFNHWIQEELAKSANQRGVKLSVFTNRFARAESSVRLKFLSKSMLAMYGLKMDSAQTKSGRQVHLIARL